MAALREHSDPLCGHPAQASSLTGRGLCAPRNVDVVAVERTPLVMPPDAAQIEAALGVVPGVARATVVPDASGGPGTLRLSLTPDGDEVVVARAVQRILKLQFGVGLDPGRIEVVEESIPEPPVVPAPRLRVVEESFDGVLELGEEIDALLAALDQDRGPGPRFPTAVLASAARHPAGAAPPSATPMSRPSAAGATADESGAPRLAITRLTVAADGLGVTATVTLTVGDREFVGRADGPSTPTALHRIVAAATIEALADVLGPEHRVDVEAVTVTAVGEGAVAVVQVVWATLDGTERLTGASEVRDDPRQAVIRATLDAVNRRLAPHLDL